MTKIKIKINQQWLVNLGLKKKFKIQLLKTIYFINVIVNRKPYYGVNGASHLELHTSTGNLRTDPLIMFTIALLSSEGDRNNSTERCKPFCCAVKPVITHRSRPYRIQFFRLSSLIVLINFIFKPIMIGLSRRITPSSTYQPLFNRDC